MDVQLYMRFSVSPKYIKLPEGVGNNSPVIQRFAE